MQWDYSSATKSANISVDEMARLAQFYFSKDNPMRSDYARKYEEMEDLIERSPRTKEELLKISGFGNVKVEKYGDKILEIVKNSQQN